MADFDPFSSGQASATTTPAADFVQVGDMRFRTERDRQGRRAYFAGGEYHVVPENDGNASESAPGEFNPFTGGAATAYPAVKFHSIASGGAYDPFEHWRAAYGGLKAAPEGTQGPMSALDSFSEDPEEDKKRAINQAFLSEQLGMTGTYLESNWDAVKSSYAKHELGTDGTVLSDKELYDELGNRLRPPGEEDENALPEMRSLPPWTWQGALSNDTVMIGRRLADFWKSLDVSTDKLPDPPDNLPDTSSMAGYAPMAAGNSAYAVYANPQIAAGIYKGVIKPYVEWQFSPTGIAMTVGGAALGPFAAENWLARKTLGTMGAVITAVMGYSTIKSLPETKRILTDPTASTQDKIAALSSTVSNTMFTLGAGVGAIFGLMPDKGTSLAEKVAGKKPSQIAEILRKEAIKAPADVGNVMLQAADHFEEVGRYEDGISSWENEGGAQGMGPRLVGAAIKASDGTVTVGDSHNEIKETLGVTTDQPARPGGGGFPGTAEPIVTGTEGFVDSEGTFHDRTESANIAEKTGQLTPEAIATIAEERKADPNGKHELHSHEVSLAQHPGSTSSFDRTALNNANDELERVAYGFPEATPTERQEMLPSWIRAGEVSREYPDAGSMVFDRLKSDPNARLTPDQTALLLRYKVDIQNRLNEAADIAADSNSGPELKAEAEKQRADLSDRLIDILNTTRENRSRWGREGRWFQAIAHEDYTFASQENLLRRSQDDKPLSEEQDAELRKNVDALAELQKKYDTLLKRKSDAAQARANVNRMSPPETPNRARVALKNQAIASKERLQTLLAGVHDISDVILKSPEATGHAAIIAADALVEFGSKAWDKMIELFGEGIRPYLDDIFERANAMLARGEIQSSNPNAAFVDKVKADPRADPPPEPSRQTEKSEPIAWLSRPGKEAWARITSQKLGIVPEKPGADAALWEKIAPDIAIVGADLMYHTGANFAKWSARVITELGEKFRPFLQRAFDKSKDLYRQNLAQSLRVRAPEEAGNLSQVALKLARTHIEDGMRDRDDIVDAVHKNLLAKEPNLTRREVADAISGYGKFKPLSKDEVDNALRDVKGQLQQVAKLEDMAAGEAPKKTGIERREPSDEERALIKKVEEEKKKGGYEVTDPAQQLKTALSSTKKRLSNQIKDLERQIETRERIVKTSTKGPRDDEVERLSARRDELKKEFDVVFGPRPKVQLTDAQRLNTLKAIWKRREAELTQKMADNDFTPKPKRAPPPLDNEAKKAKDALDRKKEDFAVARERAKEAGLPKWQKAMKHTAGTARGLVLSGYHILGKLATFSLTRYGEQFLAEGLGFYMSKMPGIMGEIFQGANMEGSHFKDGLGREFGGVYEDLAKYYTEAAMHGFEDAMETLRTGKSALKVELGDHKQNITPILWYDYPGLMHAVEKSVLLRSDLELRLNKAYNHALARGIDLTPEVEGAIRKEAYDYANRAILQENDVLAKGWNHLEQIIMTAHPDIPSAKAGMIGLRYAIDAFITKGIVKTPVNMMLQSIERSPLGLGYAAGLTSYYGVKGRITGVTGLTTQEMNMIARLWKIGSIGSAMFLWGMFDASKDPEDRMFGGFYQPGDKRSLKDVQFGKVRMLGHQFPMWVTEAPFISAQMGNTFYRVAFSRLSKKDKQNKGYLAATAATLVSLASSAPITSPIIKEAQNMEMGEADKIIWQQGATIIPGFVANLAQDLDQKSRKPSSFTEELEMNIPKLRENVPETKAQKKRNVLEEQEKKEKQRRNPYDKP